jgi:hypothetical protein
MNEIQKAAENAVVVDDELLQMGGMGKEKVTSKDVLITRITILQGLSPQIMKKKAEYIEGAELGDFCNVATGDIYKEEMLIIPCHFTTVYIEWQKNRAGIGANHGEDPSILSKCTVNEKRQFFLPNGNEVQEQAQWYVLVQSGAAWQRAFFPLKATNLKHSRKWQTLIETEQVQLPGGEFWKPPLFWRSWLLKIVDDSNDQGDWYTFRPEKGELIVNLDPTKNLIRLCKSFYEDIRTEKVKPDIEMTQDSDGPIIDGKVNKDPTKSDTAF